MVNRKDEHVDHTPVQIPRYILKARTFSYVKEREKLGDFTILLRAVIFKKNNYSHFKCQFDETSQGYLQSHHRC